MGGPGSGRRKGITTEVDSQWLGTEAKADAKKATKLTAWELALIIEGQAKLLSAVRYGYLAASYTSAASDRSTDVESPSKYGKEQPPKNHRISTFHKITAPEDPDEILVGTAVDYAPHVEFGTKFQVAQPALRPAFDLARGKKLTILEYNGKRYLQKYMTLSDINLIKKGRT